MADLKAWITQLKTEKPELSDFITKIEAFISDTGFNTEKFEKRVDSGLKNIETEVTKSFTKEDNAQDKEDND